jgi:putative DNA primase/helicase
MERLLSITGRGYLPVNRKNRQQLTCQLQCRIMLMSNDLPEWPDAAGALPQRALIVEYSQSFLGREDPSLRDRFMIELPGILNWALEGARRLAGTAVFTQPGSSAEAHEEMRDASNSVIPFVRDYCQLGSNYIISVDELYQYYAMMHGGFKDDAAQKRRFGQLLKKAFPQVARVHTRQHSHDGMKRYYYEGITLSNHLPDFARP